MFWKRNKKLFFSVTHSEHLLQEQALQFLNDQDFILLDYTANQIVYIVSKYKCVYGPCSDIMRGSRGG